MICPRCGRENNADRSDCWGCGTALVPAPAAEVATAPRVRLRIMVPLCILAGVILLASGYARWRAAHSSTDLPAAGDSPTAAAPDEKQINDALERVPLVNARANDLLRAGDFKGG